MCPFFRAFLTLALAPALAGGGPAAAAAAAQYGTRIAFVNNHLAAHQENIARRISDVREVFGGLELGYHRCRSGLSS